MQQLTLQFDGVAQAVQHVNAPAAKQQASVTEALEILSEAVGQSLSRCGSQARTWCVNHREELETYVGGSAIMATLAVLILLAAVLQGGAV